MRYLILDIEASGIADAADYIEPSAAPENYKDPVKIAAYVAAADAAQVAKAALDPDLARVVALGTCDASLGVVNVTLAKDETEERALLAGLWRSLGNVRDVTTMIVGYNVLGYDLPVLLRRSLYLGVPAPQIQIDRFKHPSVIDLMAILSYDGKLKFRSLEFYAHRFGIEHDRSISGAEIPGLVAAGKWAEIEAHVRADVTTTTALARRMGIVPAGVL